eukprot:TRINITY_DN842_c2_g1_i1.p1 TRINITY_DN842_c2_g1~~TRINITY_DN842_c2_g1_i1.p1  ORF type:complete len:400 (-),score=54.29 TRINITY_DN842_c2_g1_i1:304-1503(-)
MTKRALGCGRKMALTAVDAALRVLVVFVLSCLAVPICYILNYHAATHPLQLFLIAVAILIVMVLPYYLVVRGVGKHASDVFFYVFAIFAFTAVVDLFIAFTVDGHISMLDFYLNDGEMYLRTPHGAIINYYDGTVHLSLYLLMIFYMLTHTSYRLTGLFWGGSIINSLIVLFAGSATGVWGTVIKPSFLLNVPYALFPIIFVFRILNKRADHPSSKPSTHRSLLLRPLDLLFALAFVGLICRAVFYALASAGSPVAPIRNYRDNIDTYLGDASGFPLVQAMTVAYYFVPVFIACIYGLVYPANAHWLPDYAALLAGASTQAQISYMGGALYPSGNRSDNWRPVSQEAMPTFLLANLAPLVIPQLFAVYCCLLKQNSSSSNISNNNNSYGVSKQNKRKTN